MLNLIDQYRRYPTVDNAKLLRDYFARNPSRVWVLQSEFLLVLAAAEVHRPKVEARTNRVGCPT